MSTPNKDSRKNRIRSFWIIIDEDLCKGCNICVDFCPKEIFKKSENINPRGYYQPEIKIEGKCTGCRLCELICPELAIIIEENKL